MEDGTRRHVRWAVVLLALAAAALPALPALASTKDLTVVPAGASGSGLTDLRTSTYAAAKQRLDELSSITLPVAIPGMERLAASNVTVGADDAHHSLALTGSARLYGHDVDLLVTAIWADDAATAPKLAIAAKAKDISLSAIDSRWDASYGDARFSTARVAVSSDDQEIDPAALPEAARGFFPEPVELTGGVTFAGRLQLTGRLADAFDYAGHSGDVELEGSVGVSAAALFGHGGADLHLKATLGKSPDAPAWLAERASAYELAIADGKPAVTVDEAVTLAVDGTTNRFTGHFDVASTGAIEGALSLDGALDAPFGLDGSKLSDLRLRMSRGENGFEGGLAFAVDGVGVDARFVTEGGSTRADFTVDGKLTVPRLVALGSELLGTPVAEVPGAGDVSLDHVSFSFTHDTFSVGANATAKDLQAEALLTLRAGKQPLLGLRLSDPGCDGDCVRLAALLPQLDGPLAGLKLPAVDLVATSLTELDADDLTPQEEDFFGPGPLSFSPGVNVEGRLPLGALGLPGGDVALSGTLGGLDGSLKNLALSATVPAAATKTILPGWVTPTGPTTLSFKYEGHGVTASFGTAASVKLGGGPAISTTIAGALERAGGRTSVHFTGTLAGWKQPFGQPWLPTLDAARLELDTTFGGGPATIDASAGASFTLSGHRVDVDFALSTANGRKASITATLDHASVDELATGFKLGTVQTALPTGKLRTLSVDDVSASVTVGDGESAFAIEGTASFEGLRSDVLVAVRSGGAFTLGIRPQKPVELSRLAPVPQNVTLPEAAVVLGDRGNSVKVRDLSRQEFDFYKPLYDCAGASTPADCPDFRTLDLGTGLKLIAGFDLGDKLEDAAAKIGIQTGAHALLEGTIPVLGGKDFSLRATLGGFRFPVKNGVEQRPDWFDHGGVSLRIGKDGIGFDAGLGVRIRRDGAQWMPACAGGHVIGDGCYDVLDFKVSADVTHSPLSFTLTGGLVADGTWSNAFGQSWLAIKAVKLQLGVTVGPTGPQVTMGFLGDVTIGSKDVAAALKVGLAPLTAPPFVRVDLIGFSFASQAGLSLSDLLWLNEQITHTHLDASSLPDVSLRNLYVQFAQQDDNQLCLTKGLRFNADLYAGRSLQESPAISDSDRDAATGCRKLDTDPQARQSCRDRRDDGCLASVYGHIDAGGLVAGGELNAFTVGPISLDDTSLALALTPNDQRLSFHGGARIGTDDYEFASGRADLDISRSGFKFAGDARLFGKDGLHGYLEASAPFDVNDPAFTVNAWLGDEARGDIAGDVTPKLEAVKPVLAGLSGVVQFVTGSGSVTNVRDLPGKLTDAGVAVPDEVKTMARVLGDAQQTLADYGQSTSMSLDQLLKGFSFGLPGIPGVWSPGCWGYVDENGTCWGIPAPSKCIGQVIDGTCWATPPATISIGGICSALGVSGSNCSWKGLIALYVRPALAAALEGATGVHFDPATFEDGLNRLLSALTRDATSVFDVECASFSADASALASGRVDVQLSAKLRVFGQTLLLGSRWDFAAEGGSPREILTAVLRALITRQSATCSPPPAVPAEPAGAELRSVALTPTEQNEGDGPMKVRVTFAPQLSYPAVRVNWGDGATDTIPAGIAGSVNATHSYAKSGRYTVTAVAQDDGGSARQATAFVDNVAPALTWMDTAPLPANENGQITASGGFADPGTGDRHTVTVDWGDGSAPEPHTLETGVRRFAFAHRYTDDGSYMVTATVADETGAKAAAKRPAPVIDVAPSAVVLKPLSGTIAGDLIPVGAHVTYGIDFTDPGTRDKETITIDWGDGGVPQTYPVGLGSRHVEIPHTYIRDGLYGVHLSVTDDDGARAETVTSVRVIKPS